MEYKRGPKYKPILLNLPNFFCTEVINIKVKAEYSTNDANHTRQLYAEE